MLGWRRISEETVEEWEQAQTVDQQPGSNVKSRRPETRTEVVRANLEGLVASHHETNLLGLLVLEETNVASSSFLPLGRATVETEELGTPMHIAVSL